MPELNESEIKKRFGARLRAARKKQGLSQEKLALACDLDRTYIGGVERGERNISLLNIYRIVYVLSIDAGSLLDD